MNALRKFAWCVLTFAAVLAIGTLVTASLATRSVMGYSTAAVTTLTAAFGFPTSFAIPLAAVMGVLVPTLLFYALRRRTVGLVLFLLGCAVALVAGAELLRWRVAGINFGGPSVVYVCQDSDGRLERSAVRTEPVLGTHCDEITPREAIVIEAQANPAPRRFEPRTLAELLAQPRLDDTGRPVLLAGVAPHGKDQPRLYTGILPALDPQAIATRGLLHAATNADLAATGVALEAKERARANAARHEALVAARDQREAADRMATNARLVEAQKALSEANASADREREAHIAVEHDLAEARVAAQPALAESTTDTAAAPPATSVSAPTPELETGEVAPPVTLLQDQCGRRWRSTEPPPATPCPIYIQVARVATYPPSMPRMPVGPAFRPIGAPWLRFPSQRPAYPVFRSPRRR